MNYNYEVWKPLFIENMMESEKYEVSNYGRVKSFKRDPDGIILKCSNSSRYFRFDIKLASGKMKTLCVHKMVAELFLPKDNDSQECVIHLDYNRFNNRVNNLKWVTKETMFQHHKLNPNYLQHRGKPNNSKLSETQVIRLKLKLKRGNTAFYKIAKEFGITHTQLNRIRKGENWGHITV